MSENLAHSLPKDFDALPAGLDQSPIRSSSALHLTGHTKTGRSYGSRAADTIPCVWHVNSLENPQMQIRVATLNDAAAISQLIRPLAEKYIAHEFSPEGVASLLSSVTPDAIAGCLASEYEYHIAEKDGKIVGVVGVRDKSHLYHLFVADEFRGQGVARELWLVALAACRQVADTQGITVNSSKFAVEMYRRFGFVQTGPGETKNGVTSFPMRFTVTG